MNAALYREVGDTYRWHNRRVWTEEEWAAYALSPDTRTLLGMLDGETLGYAELVRLPEKVVELRLFGLRPVFLGRGLGAPS
ncbi:GNAT family N-acetyltransferase [Deinococcus hopiensis]|uniref:GNAT family N-acetyltransferase n=1 Tax=Deinococcus hopiensis TaxID=309885 RepID=UPI000A04FD8A|nr:GNAT family N-acetyltransferase [Deinococcus hopiensis]